MNGDQGVDGIRRISGRLDQPMAEPEARPALGEGHRSHHACIAVYLREMLTNPPALATVLDRDLIGFLTAVDSGGQPQTAPVWFVRDGEDIVVYNKPATPRLDSIAANPKVAFSLRGDRAGTGVVVVEGTAIPDRDLPPAKDFPGYLDKYDREIESLGWTPDEFSEGYATGIRITVTRVRASGLDNLDSK